LTRKYSRRKAQLPRLKATENQIIQLKKKQGLKQQYEFAQKSIERYGNMLKDSLVPKPMMKYLPNIKEHRLSISLFKLN
jgi:hypothetical protein